MTEQQWFACEFPEEMLSWLAGTGRRGEPCVSHPAATEQRLRLFADACREHFFGSAANGGTESRWEGEARHRDDAMSPLAAARGWAYECSQKSLRASLLREVFGNPFRPRREVMCSGSEIGSDGAVSSGKLSVSDVPGVVPAGGAALPPAVLRWNDGLVVRLARSIYDERAWHKMPILGDALLDAGCEDEELMAHCLGDGPHARGCWALDLILGKE